MTQSQAMENAVSDLAESAMNQAELDKRCDDHALALSGRGGFRANFDGQSLNGLSFANRDLREASFKDADLTGCDLSGTNLTNADLSGACLADAKLIGATLDGADLRGCDMSGADLSASQCQNADFRELARLPSIGSGQTGSQIKTTRLDGAQFGGVNFSYARLSGVEADNADFSDANFNKSRLMRAKLKNAVLQGAILTGTDLSGADLSDADLRGAIERDLRLEAAITNGLLKGDRPDLTDDGITIEPDDDPRPLSSKLRDHERLCRSGGKDGAPASFNGMDLREAGSLADRELTAMPAQGANFAGLDMRNIALQGARLSDADLRGCDLRGADLRGADLRRAKLSHADLRGAKLEALQLGGTRRLPVQLDQANCRYARFTDTEVSQASVKDCDLAYARIATSQLETLHQAGALTEKTLGD